MKTTIIQLVEKVTNWDKPQLVELYTDGKKMVILTEPDSNEDIFFSGTVVYSETNETQVGDYRQGLDQNKFVLFKGTLKLTND